MAEQSQRATLADVLNYQPDEYLSKEEVDIIRNTFKYNPVLLKILRKILIPTINDPDLPLENLANDFKFDGRQWSAIPADEAKILICARQDAFQFIAGGLIKLKVIANQQEESEQETKLRRQKDSTK